MRVRQFPFRIGRWGLWLLACLCLGPGGLQAQIFKSKEAQYYLGKELHSPPSATSSLEAGFFDQHSLYSVSYVNLPWPTNYHDGPKGRLLQKKATFYPFHQRLFLGLGLRYQQEQYQESLAIRFVDSAGKESLVEGDFKLKRSGFCVVSFLRPAWGLGINLCSYPFIQSSDYSFAQQSNPGQVSPQRIQQAVEDWAESANRALDGAFFHFTLGVSF